MTKLLDLKLPENITAIADTYAKHGFSVYLVGGCVRSILTRTEPRDWDMTTDAPPEKTTEMFPHTVYNNSFGTVTIIDDENPKTCIEITTFRGETGYKDKRRPDAVKFGISLEEDLSRRDFTINAIALNPLTGDIIDLYHGMADLKKGVIRTVGDPTERFTEDALRLIRAVRIAAEWEYDIEEETKEALFENAHFIEEISIERVRNEFERCILSDNPMKGMYLLYETGLLSHIIPELELGISIDQNQAHKYDVFEHNIRTLQHAAHKGYSLELRLAALLHDVAKPHTREWSKEKEDWTFYAHEILGAKLAKIILNRMKFPKQVTADVRELVRWHMFFSDTEKMTLAGARRMVTRVGEEKMRLLIDLRKCDRIGTGRPKEFPYRLRKYQAMIEEALRSPLSTSILKIDGEEIMKILNEKPGKKIGWILNTLLEEALIDISKNKRDYLLSRVKELSELPEEELEKLGEKGKEKIYEEDQKAIDEIRKRHNVS